MTHGRGESCIRLGDPRQPDSGDHEDRPYAYHRTCTGEASNRTPMLRPYGNEPARNPIRRIAPCAPAFSTTRRASKIRLRRRGLQVGDGFIQLSHESARTALCTPHVCQFLEKQESSNAGETGATVQRPVPGVRLRRIIIAKSGVQRTAGLHRRFALSLILSHRLRGDPPPRRATWGAIPRPPSGGRPAQDP